MDELMDMIVADESPSQISDKIKDLLYAKSAEKVNEFKPNIASSLFGDSEETSDETPEVEPEDSSESGEE